MKLYEKVAANIIAKPIINYLQENNPARSYTSKYVENIKNDELVTTITVAERALFNGKIICTIDNYLHSRNTVFKSNDTEVLPQETLEKIAKTIDVREIILSAAEIQLNARKSA
jgi:hypothetical protein